MFKKGNTLGEGRKKGSTNKTTAQAKDFILKVVSNNLDTIESDFLELESKDRIRLTIDLLGYVLPKQKAVEVSMDKQDFNPITIKLLK